MSRSSEPAEQIRAVAEVVDAILGASLAGLYLYGSALDALKPASDLDFLAIAARPLGEAEKRALVASLTPLSARSRRPAGWHPVELTVVAADDIRPWRYPPLMDFQFGEWSRADYDAGRYELSASPNPDLATICAMVRAQGRALRGPTAAQLLDPVPVADRVGAMIDSLPSLQDHLEADTANVLLTLARIAVTLDEGRFVSKEHAATSLLAGDGGERCAALAHARDAYLGVPPDDWTTLLAAARECADSLIAKIRRLAAQTPPRAWLQSR